MFLILVSITSSGCTKIECTQQDYCKQYKCIIKNPADVKGICAEQKKNNWILCPETKGEFCIQVYEPVCSNDGKTYSNSCTVCKEAKAYKRGECNGEKM